MTTQEERTFRALNILAKWRVLFTGWQVGTRPKGDPEGDAIRDHRELSILLRAEMSTLTGLLLRKGVFTDDEWNAALELEATQLNQDYERKFPGVTAQEDGLTFDKRALPWMKGVEAMTEHVIVWREIHLTEPDEYEEIPVCGRCVPKHSSFRTRADVPEGGCEEIRAPDVQGRPGVALRRAVRARPRRGAVSRLLLLNVWRTHRHPAAVRTAPAGAGRRGRGQGRGRKL